MSRRGRPVPRGCRTATTTARSSPTCGGRPVQRWRPSSSSTVATGSPDYGLDQLDPLADRLTRLGYATWNVEYRRTGGGGDCPAPSPMSRPPWTGSADQSGLSQDVITLGHSAGGHLAVWAASRTEETPGGSAKLPVKGAISLAGVLDLTRAADVPGSSRPVSAFVGGSPDQVPDAMPWPTPRDSSPRRVRCTPCTGRTIRWSPRAEHSLRQSGDRCRWYGRAGHVPGDHHTIIDPAAASFRTIESLIGRASGAA